MSRSPRPRRRFGAWPVCSGRSIRYARTCYKVCSGSAGHGFGGRYAVILLIDNYDSFVHNLARYFRRLGQETFVVRNDAITPEAILRRSVGAVVLSPGPCGPEQAGCCLEVVRALAGRVPLLGVCLGHQCVGAAFGAQVVRSGEPAHGRASEVYHQGHWLFAGVETPFRAARYHSLVLAPELPSQLECVARLKDGTPMAVVHRRHLVVGVQFHPESVLTDQGYRILANFLRRCGLSVSRVPQLDEECLLWSRPGVPLPQGG